VAPQSSQIDIPERERHASVKHQVAIVDYDIPFVQLGWNVDAKSWSGVRLRARRTDTQKQERCQNHYPSLLQHTCLLVRLKLTAKSAEFLTPHA